MSHSQPPNPPAGSTRYVRPAASAPKPAAQAQPSSPAPSPAAPSAQAPAAPAEPRPAAAQGGVSKGALLATAQEQAILIKQQPNAADIDSGRAAHLALLNSPAFSAELHTVCSPEVAKRVLEHAIIYVSDSTSESYANLCRCSSTSVGASVKRLASLGLVPNATTGDAFLTPRKTTKDGWICSPMPGVIGWERKIREAFPRSTLTATTVYDQDKFECNEGLNPVVNYQRNMRIDYTKPNPIVGAFCLIREEPGPNARIQIRTTAIRDEQVLKTTDTGQPIMSGGKQVTERRLTNQEGRVLVMGRMGAEAASKYSVQRAAMREVARTWAAPESTLGQMLALEEEFRRAERETQGEGEGRVAAVDFKARRKALVRDKAAAPSADAADTQPQEQEIPQEETQAAAHTAGQSV